MHPPTLHVCPKCKHAHQRRKGNQHRAWFECRNPECKATGPSLPADGVDEQLLALFWNLWAIAEEQGELCGDDAAEAMTRAGLDLAAVDAVIDSAKTEEMIENLLTQRDDDRRQLADVMRYTADLLDSDEEAG